jgi:uncharacterized protein YqgC (DUF456 family)
MDEHAVGLVLVALAIIAAAVFTIAPLIPGTIFIILGAIAYGLVDTFQPFAWWFWLAQAVFVVLYLITDNVVQAFGVKKGGGSRESIIGGTVGVIAGPFVLAPISGPLAILLGPPIGAVVGTVVGERYARRKSDQALLDRGQPEGHAINLSGETGAAPPSSYRKLSGWALVSFFAGTMVKFGILGIQAILLVAVVW